MTEGWGQKQLNFKSRLTLKARQPRGLESGGSPEGYPTIDFLHIQSKTTTFDHTHDGVFVDEYHGRNQQ